MKERPDSSAEGAEGYSFTREMGLTHAEFYRSLPPAIAHRAYSVEDDRVLIEFDERTVIIELGPQRYRSIASLRLPYAQVRFTFLGFSPGERQDFMDRFELYFQRGGG